MMASQFLASVRRVVVTGCMRIMSMITVEPTLLLLTAGMQLLGHERGLFLKICEQTYGWQGGVVNCRSNVRGSVRERIVADVDAWGLYTAVAQVIPIIIVAPLYGAFSDRYGRKTIILLAITGLVLKELVYIAELTWVALPLELLPLGAFFLAIFTGSYNVTLMPSCFAYVCDREPNKSRLTMRFALLQFIMTLAPVVIAFSVGLAVYIHNMRVEWLSVVSIGLFTIAFFYTLVRLTEVPPRVLEEQQQRQSPNDNATVLDARTEGAEPSRATTPKKRSEICLLASDALRIGVKPREGHYRAYIWLLLVVFFVIESTHVPSKITLLTMISEPLNWSLKQQANYNFAASLVILLGPIICAAIMKFLLRFHETSVLVVAIAVMALKSALLGSELTSATMYTAAALGFAGPLATFVSLSLVSQFVRNDEVAKIFTVFQLVGDFAVLAGKFGLTGIYVRTYPIFPGSAFILMAIAQLITLAIALAIHIDYQRYRCRREAAVNTATPAAANSEIPIQLVSQTQG